MIMDLFIKLSPILTAIIGGALVHVFQRNKYWAEVKKTKAERNRIEIETMDSTVNLWRKIIGDLQTDVVALTQEVTAVREQNKLLTEQNIQLSMEIGELRKENGTLKYEMRKLEQYLKKLKNPTDETIPTEGVVLP